MDIVSFAVGFALGRRNGGGGGGSSEKAFHSFLDAFVPAYSCTLNSTYRMVVGASLPTVNTADFATGELPELATSHYELMNVEKDAENTFAYLLVPGIMGYLCYVIYKDNVPIYVNVFDTWLSYYPFWSGYDGVSSSQILFDSFFYAYEDNYTLDRISNINCTEFNYTQGFTVINTDLSFTCEYSYQRYEVYDKGTYDYAVRKRGGRTSTGTTTRTSSIPIAPVSNSRGVFTDLSYSDFTNEMQAVLYAICERFGVATAPVKIIYPDD